jgi:hypothetical protein
VLTNDSSWFADLPESGETTYHKLHSPQQLEARLTELLAVPIVERDSWERVVARHVADYRRLTGHGDSVEAPSWSGGERDAEAYRIEVAAVPALAGSVGAGRQQTLTMSVRNLSGRPLSGAAEAPVRLAARWTALGDSPFEETVYAELDQVLLPGARGLASMQVTAPAQPGRYELHVTLDEVGAGLFSDRYPASGLDHQLSVAQLSGAPLQRPRTPIAASAQRAVLSAALAPTVHLGEELTVPLRVTNLGPEALFSCAPAPVMIGIRWYDALTGQLLGEAPRQVLPLVIGSGDSEQFEIRMAAPRPGLWTVRIGLVQDSSWFDEQHPLAAHTQTLLIER